MPFQGLLDRMMNVKGVEAVAFLDQEGETILTQSRGEADHLKILGAYQGIIMSTVVNIGMNTVRTMFTSYTHRSVLTHRLKDGYFICALLSKDLPYAQAQFAFGEIYSLIENEL
jgi:hypothetical protein